jgi:hypothetical protein
MQDDFGLGIFSFLLFSFIFIFYTLSYLLRGVGRTMVDPWWDLQSHENMCF